MEKIILSIEGMTCSACSNGLEKYLQKQDGILQASINLVMANASIEYDEKKLTVDDLDRFVKNAGFESLGEFQEIKIENVNKKARLNLIIHTILIILIMYISMGHMLNLPTIKLLDPIENPINYIVVLLILSCLFIIYGFDILKSGYKNFIHHTPNMDTLVGIGVLSSFLFSLYSAFLALKGDHNHIMNLYFESVATIIYFVKLGRFIDQKSKDKTKEAIKNLVTITPNKATIIIEGKEKEVTLDMIKQGDILVCKAGEKIAVDGTIVKGQAHFDQAFITGESKPVSLSIDDQVIAGSINYDGYIEYKAERIGKETTVSEIVKLVLESSNSKVPIARLADKIASYFVPTVIIIAIITFITYLLMGKNIETSLITLVTILVVACPCSLGLATPLAIIVSEGLCASNGILIKKSEILENANKMDTIVFDKTGTLTYGKLKIKKIYNYSDLTEKELLIKIGSIESNSTHPIANAFTEYLKDNNLEKLNVQKYKEIPGLGIKAIINKNEYLLGNLKLLENEKIKNNHLEEADHLKEIGCSIVYVVENNKIIALIGVNDIIRSEAKQVIASLKRKGFKIIMLTGDNNETATKIGKELNIDEIVSEVLPKDKSNIIKKLKENGKRVIMCGDGINDSPSLALADIGISLNSGMEIAIDSSDVILISNNLESILNLINISEKTITNIKQNLFWAFFYNTLMIPLAIGLFKPFNIIINPMIASLAMVLSSTTVILNALRLKNILNKKKKHN